jgi:glycosyltransferase involved in cell wall biosynthesis
VCSKLGVDDDPCEDAAMTLGGGLPALVCLAPNRWDGPRQRTQHLAAGLARTRPVVFVEPAAYSLPGILRRQLAGERTGPLLRRVRQVTDNLLVYSPPPTLPGSLHFRSINSLVHSVAWRDLRAAVRTIDSSALDVLVSWPPAFELARHLRPQRLIYDCLDLFPAFEKGFRRQLLTRLENDLAQAASVVVVTSRDLERRWSGRHRRVVRIPNGVDLTAFGPGAGPMTIPPDIARLPRPRMGYIGTIGPWLDLPLLQHLAQHRPGCSIALIGPVERGIARPSGPANLHLLGERPYSSLPAYLAGMDVLLIPFRLTDLTRAVNPIKLYEYCASGKPIVATPLEEVVAAGGVCYIGEGHGSFLKAVDDALLEADRPDPVRVAARHAIALVSGWDRRVAAFAALLDAEREHRD